MKEMPPLLKTNYAVSVKQGIAQIIRAIQQLEDEIKNANTAEKVLADSLLRMRTERRPQKNKRSPNEQPAYRLLSDGGRPKSTQAKRKINNSPGDYLKNGKMAKTSQNFYLQMRTPKRRTESNSTGYPSWRKG